MPPEWLTFFSPGSALFSFLGIVLILALAYACSNNRKAIDWALVGKGLLLQVILGFLLLKVPALTSLFQTIGHGIEGLLAFADKGASFVFGSIVSQPIQMENLFGAGGGFILAVKLLSSLILVSSLVSIAYHLNLLQSVVRGMAWAFNKVLRVSGAEALSNTASVFVGQVEAQLLVKPYLATMTRSELLAVMAGSMACISGGTMAIYISLGIPADYLLTASLMAIPGALVIAKILMPETEQPATRGDVSLHVESKAVNLIDAAAQGALEGGKIGLNVIVMLIAFVSLIAMADAGLGLLGQLLMQMGVPAAWLGLAAGQSLTFSALFGQLFYWPALFLGLAVKDANIAASLMGTKLVVNEFVAYANLIPLIKNATLDPRSVAIISFALCGFANLGSVAIQVGGIGAMVPERKSELARLGLWALLGGTLASYLSAAWAGVLLDSPASSFAFLDSFALSLSGVFAFFGSLFGGLFKFFIDMFSFMGAGLGSFLGSAFGGLFQPLLAFFLFLGSILGAIVLGLGVFFSSLFSSIGWFFNAIASFFGTSFQGLGDAFHAIGSFFVSLFQNFFLGLAALFAALGSFFTSLASGTAQFSLPNMDAVLQHPVFWILLAFAAVATFVATDSFRFRSSRRPQQ
jgi:concentrative nucleoside transporter, CNT family